MEYTIDGLEEIVRSAADEIYNADAEFLFRAIDRLAVTESIRNILSSASLNDK